MCSLGAEEREMTGERLGRGVARSDRRLSGSNRGVGKGRDALDLEEQRLIRIRSIGERDCTSSLRVTLFSPGCTTNQEAISTHPSTSSPYSQLSPLRVQEMQWGKDRLQRT